MNRDLYKANPHSDDQADLFARRAVANRNDTLRALRQVLEEGPPGRGPLPADVARHEWFHSLDYTGKKKVMEIARVAVDWALYGVMLELDNLDPTDDDQFWDFSAYVQVYEDRAAYEADRPVHRSEKLNIHEDTEELHDRYQILVDEVDESVRNEWDRAEREETNRRIAEENRKRGEE